MTAAKTYRDLIVWQEAHDFVLEVYKMSNLFPDDEKFGLTSQLRRSSVSVASNIAEGFPRWTNADKLRFYNMAESSLSEADYQLLLAHDLGYADTSTLQSQAERVKNRLINFIKSIRID